MKQPQLHIPEREWEGQDAFLIGGGPSLTGFDFNILAGRNVIGCNDAFRLGSNIVSICAFGDHTWWERNKFTLSKFPNRLATSAPTMLPYNVPRLMKFTRVRDGIHTGSVLGWNYSTGAMSINLAITLGAKRIFLLGYDLCNQKTASHWHKYNQVPIKEPALKRFIGGFKTLQRQIPKGVEVFNVSDGTTKLDCFPVISFEQFLAMLDKPKRTPARSRSRAGVESDDI